MGTDLDDILTQLDCPCCGTAIRLRYGQLRIQKAAACACGALITLVDDTAIGRVQAPIDGTDPVLADAD